MARKFDYFVILAGMRTGSNYLEENLNQYPGLRCHGELFNPHFLGGPRRAEKFGISMQDRTKNPRLMIEKLKALTDGLHGFRYFHDHDPRIFGDCMQDARCGKIVLTRNPVDSYVSREIVRQTQQWRLGDMKGAKTAKIVFAATDFAAHLNRHQEFQTRVLKALQSSGQAGFYLAYEDIGDVKVINGLARFLGLDAVAKKPVTKTKKQNPQPLRDKVVNFSDMEAALASADYFSLNRAPSFEPRRGAALPGYVAAAKTSLLFAPIASGPTLQITRWLADLDGVAKDDLITGFTQKTMRHWKRKSGRHRTFTVLRHPVPRLHDAFVRRILVHGKQNFAVIRRTLIGSYGLKIPLGDPDQAYGADQHKAAFIAFAGFVKGNLDGQTGIRVDPAWASQSEILRGFGQFVLPDYIIREQELVTDLGHLAGRFAKSSPDLVAEPDPSPVALQKIYDGNVEAAVKSAYQRDYMMFGFGPWTNQSASERG